MTKTYPKTKYEYYDPKRECCHPSRMLDRVEIIYEQDEGDASNSFTVAKLYKKNMKKGYGIRWNIALDQYNDDRCKAGNLICLGFPYSHSYPTWFVLPQGTEIKDDKIIIPIKKS